MFTRRLLAITVAVSVFLGLLAAPAMARQVSGGGKTRRYATLGFVAQRDLSGHLTYISSRHPFSARCSGYTSFRRTRGPNGKPRIRVTATCHRKSGKRVYLKASLVDRGEPPTRDWARIFWGRKRNVTWKTAMIRDRGYISGGNIQIV